MGSLWIEVKQSYNVVVFQQPYSHRKIPHAYASCKHLSFFTPSKPNGYAGQTKFFMTGDGGNSPSFFVQRGAKINENEKFLVMALKKENSFGLIFRFGNCLYEVFRPQWLSPSVLFVSSLSVFCNPSVLVPRSLLVASSLISLHFMPPRTPSPQAVIAMPFPCNLLLFVSLIVSAFGSRRKKIPTGMGCAWPSTWCLQPIKPLRASSVFIHWASVMFAPAQSLHRAQKMISLLCFHLAIEKLEKHLLTDTQQFSFRLWHFWIYPPHHQNSFIFMTWLSIH